MKIQKLKVIDIPWDNPESKQSTIEFESLTGQRFTCFSDGYRFTVGEIAEIKSFSYLDFSCENSYFDDYFIGNNDCEKKLNKIGEWEYIAYGEIVDIVIDCAIVDCGGVLITIDFFTSDLKAIGQFIRFNIDRLEVEKYER